MKNATPADTFAAFPHVQTVCVSSGHAYGMAKYTGPCPFTGAQIWAGEAIRKIKLETRDGRVREGYTANRIFAAMKFTGACPSPSSWLLVGSGWENHRAEIIASLDKLHRVTLLRADLESTSYNWNGTKWSGKRYSEISTKQLAATLRRTKNVVAYTATKRGTVFTGPDVHEEVRVAVNGRRVATLTCDGETLHDLFGTPPEDAVQECIQNLETLISTGVFHASV